TADYYPEGYLIWLEVDTLIRQKTNGQKSLNDFCRIFYGGAGGPPAGGPFKIVEGVGGPRPGTPHDLGGGPRGAPGSEAPRAPPRGSNTPRERGGLRPR